MFEVYVTNESTALSTDEVRGAMWSFHLYTYHIRSAWSTRIPNLKFGEEPGPNDWQIRIIDDADIQGALGYHDFTPDGKPISYVFAKTAKENGYSWTVTLTHELAEMLVDPYIRRAEEGPDGIFYALEACDPCEAEKFGYEINGILVSDFICPAWFQPAAKAGPFDYKGHIKAPFTVLDGGYAYYYDKGWYSIDNFRRATKIAGRDRTRKD